jgi:hypothetical protein
MTDSPGNKISAKPKASKSAKGQDDERMEDEEKILAGRYDVNYPAMLTKDVPGG